MKKLDKYSLILHIQIKKHKAMEVNITLMGIRHYLIREYKDKGVTYNYSVNAQQHQGITSLLIKGIYNVEQQLLKEKT